MLPDQPPVAAQEVALVELHDTVDAPPLAMLVGLAPSVTDGSGTTVTVADPLFVPPLPVQVIV